MKECHDIWPFFFVKYHIKIYTVCVYAAIHPGYVLAVYLAISSLTFPFVWQTKVTFYNKDQFSSSSSSRERERERKKKGILMDTFNLWEDILGFFSYSIFLICTFFSLCVCGREKGWVRFPQFFYSLANIYTRVNAGVYSIYTIQ